MFIVVIVPLFGHDECNKNTAICCRNDLIPWQWIFVGVWCRILGTQLLGNVKVWMDHGMVKQHGIKVNFACYSSRSIVGLFRYEWRAMVQKCLLGNLLVRKLGRGLEIRWIEFSFVLSFFRSSVPSLAHASFQKKKSSFKFWKFRNFRFKLKIVKYQFLNLEPRGYYLFQTPDCRRHCFWRQNRKNCFLLPKIRNF